MKAVELREMSDEQLELTLRETAQNYFRLRIQAQTERLDAPSELRHHRRLIAPSRRCSASEPSNSNERPRQQPVRPCKSTGELAGSGGLLAERATQDSKRCRNE